MACLSALAVLAAAFGTPALDSGSVGSGSRANILMVLTDDQDIVLNEMLDAPLGPMEKTKRLLQSAGATGAKAFVNVPICCPSRANILSGRYAHNLRDAHYEPFPPGVQNCGDESIERLKGEALPCGCMRMNISSFGAFETQTFASHLQQAGYTTVYFGKYLNPPAMVKYCRNETLGPLLGGWPAGWDVFYGMCDQASGPAGAYYDVNWVDSVADAVTFTGNAPEEYTTSVIGNKTVDWIKASAAKSSPFLAIAATRAPHAPYLPPPWYEDRFAGIESPRSLGSYNASTAGKPPWMASNLPLSADDADHFDEVMRRRWGALLAVDDLVEGVVGALDTAGVLDSTYIFYWSDHGYHLGSFRLAEGKMHFYDHDSRVPFLFRGPGIEPGLTIDRLIGNVDLAPTFLDIAGVSLAGLSPPIDGRSLLPLVTAPSTAARAAAAGAATGGPNSCDPDPCNGHGVCLEPVKPQCFCNSGYAGATCDRCAPGHEGYPGCAAVPWREHFLIEYYPIENYETPAAQAKHVRINDGPENTFRALRIYNATHNMVYAEVTTLKDWFFEAPEFFELYDMRTDPYQLNNIYYTAAGSPLHAALHAELAALWGCVGDACP